MHVVPCEDLIRCRRCAAAYVGGQPAAVWHRTRESVESSDLDPKLRSIFRQREQSGEAQAVATNLSDPNSRRISLVDKCIDGAQRVQPVLAQEADLEPVS